jgi:hypothetical protein
MTLSSASEMDNTVKVTLGGSHMGGKDPAGDQSSAPCGMHRERKEKTSLAHNHTNDESSNSAGVALNRRHGIAVTPRGFSAFPVFCNVFKTVLNLGYLLLKHCKFMLKVVRFTSQGRNSTADKEYAFSP